VAPIQHARPNEEWQSNRLRRYVRQQLDACYLALCD
jgi:hypothetical protein